MADKKKQLSQIERREKIIKDRAARLARDAKKQGITPEQLLKKKRDTYLGVVGGAASLALPFGAILRGATALFKGIGGAAKVSKVAKVGAENIKKISTAAKNMKKSKTSKTSKTGTGAKLKPRNQEQAKIKKRLEKKKTPTKQTKKVDKKKTDTKKKVSGSVVPKAIGAGGAAAILTTIIAKNKDGSAKAGAMPKSRPKSIKPKDFGMGRMDDFGKGRRKGDPEGGTAPIKPKKKKSDVSQGSTMAKTPKKAKPITAGSNVGFGPKGNIFPSNAAERKKLMDKFGGTGSAAAKAAAKGRQGNLKKVSRT
jgi:hypothetical protein